MAKKGEFFPWRVIFRHPDGTGGRIPLSKVSDVLREGSALLYRGADIDIAKVDIQTRKSVVLRTITAGEVSFDKDLGAQHYAHAETLRAWMTDHPVTAPKG